MRWGTGHDMVDYEFMFVFPFNDHDTAKGIGCNVWLVLTLTVNILTSLIFGQTWEVLSNSLRFSLWLI